MKRRFFLFAAPAIVAAPSLMKVSALAMPPKVAYNWYAGYQTLHLPIDAFGDFPGPLTYSGYSLFTGKPVEETISYGTKWLTQEIS